LVLFFKKEPLSFWETSSMPSITGRLAAFVAETRYEDLPPPVVRMAKRLILDTFGNAIGGFATDAARLALASKRELGGTPHSTVFVTGEKTSCTSAAFCNATLASALEADDTCLTIGHHGQCSIMPALAVGERMDVSGRDFITAVAVAYELGARVAGAMRHVVRGADGQLQFSASGGGVNWVIFPAAGGAARMFGLDAEQTANTLGIAGALATVPTGARWDLPPRPHMKYNPYAFMAESGTTAAVFSKNGFTGSRDIFDGDASTMNANWWQLCGCPGHEADDAVRGLNERWIMVDASIKPYPSCRFTHGPLALFERIVAEQKLSVDEIEGVDIYAIRQMFGFKMDNPEVGGAPDCEFSMPHCIAMAALGIPPGPRWVAPAYWSDPKVAAIKAKVRCLPYERGDAAMVEQLLAGRWQTNPHAVSVRARGRVFELSADCSPGDPFNDTTAWSDADVERKFRNFTAQGMVANHVDRCIETIDRLESLPSLRSLVGILF
jgi:2-methylcitrate dehydratase PrpD